MWALAVVCLAGPLSRQQLANVSSIACLQQLQQDPTAGCGDAGAPPLHPGEWFIGEFPSPAVTSFGDGGASHDECRSGGEYFCDPDGVLTDAQREAVIREVRLVRENTLVECGLPWIRARSFSPNTNTPKDNVNFVLGVAVLRSVPSSEMSSEALGRFGQWLLTHWRLSDTSSSDKCDRAAILVVAADAHVVGLGSQTCRFACPEEDSGERVISALSGADDGSLDPTSEESRWDGRIIAGLHTYVEVLKAKKGDAVAQVAKVDYMTNYLRRREKAWHNTERWAYIVLGIVLGSAAVWGVVHFFPRLVNAFLQCVSAGCLALEARTITPAAKYARSLPEKRLLTCFDRV